MSLYNLFSSYRRNLTSPLPHWHRGTAFQIDAIKNHPEMHVVHTELGADVVVLTMAARITQSMFILVRNLLYRRQIGWKILPEAWKNKVFQAVLWMCWNILDILLAVEVTSVCIYKNTCKHSMHGHTKQTMNGISIYCHKGCGAEPNQTFPEKEELPCPIMEAFQNDPALDDNSNMDWDCDLKVFSDADILMSKETILPSCTNPIILSMICVPSEDCESSVSSEECIPDESESEEISEEDSLEDTSEDSGMQESWTPKSKEDFVDGEDDESDWSSEEEDSWDEESETDCSKDADLWASFCRSDDPYNPLSFAMPTRSPTQQCAEVKKEMLPACCEEQISARSSPKASEHQDCQEIQKCTIRSRAKKPVISSFKSSHKCASKKDELESSDLTDLNTPVKKVRFSSDVTVHHMITWDYAYRAARKGPWEQYARDSCRFRKRIAEAESAIGFCLEPQHREKIWASLHCKVN